MAVAGAVRLGGRRRRGRPGRVDRRSATLARDTIGQVRGAAALVGREGRLLLPVARTQRGKVRMAMPGGGHVDLVAESDDDAVLAAGADVLIVEVRGNVAVVEPRRPPSRHGDR